MFDNSQELFQIVKLHVKREYFWVVVVFVFGLLFWIYKKRDRFSWLSERVARVLVSSWWLVLLAIVVLGFVVRLYKIDSPIADWHSWRQADTASVARIYLEDGVDLLRPRYQDISYLQSGKLNLEGWRFVEFPIFNAIHVMFVSLYPGLTVEMWGRLVSVLASTVSVVLIFFLGRRFLGTAGGLLSAFFFAFLPFNIYFSRVVLPEPLAVTFGLGALVMFTGWFTSSLLPSEARYRSLGQAKYLFLSAILFSVAMLIKPYMIFYGVPMFWLAGRKYMWQWKRMVRDRDLWTFFLVVMVPVLLWRFWMAQFPEGIPFYKWVFNSDGIRFRPSFWHWIFGERLGQLILGGWGIFVFVAGLVAKNRAREFAFPLVFGLGMFLYVSVIASANVRHDYYQTLIIPAVALILARGVLFLWNNRFLPQPAANMLVLASVFMALLFSSYDIREFYKVNHPEIIRAGKALDEIAPKDALVVAPYNGDTAFLYQTGRRGWPYQTRSIEELISLGADYYVSVNLADPQTQDVMRKFEIPVQTEEYVIVDLNRKRLPK